MANTVTGPTNQLDGEKKLIVYCSVLSDGSASSTTLVDVSGLNTSTLSGAACAHASLNKVWYSVGGGTDAPASLDWDADTDVTFLTLSYDNSFDFSEIGGLKNTAATGYSGDVLLVIPSTSDAGNEYTVWCEFLKYYEAPGS
jgi:hypothetical protein|tara:strand:- start:4423 stop:4848 length:426 start_codon:yes stop_codon:yes gene_type:complete